jgi:excinuclease ABC subunit A
VIQVTGAREHNLRDISVTIPREALVTITGLSGSGKSSLAFDTLYAEGQRRYVESLSAYARQFLGQMDKPDVDHIDGLSPAISIDQKTTSRNPRSTVATVTEVYDYLRLLFARVGDPHCPECGRPISGQTVEQIAEQVLRLLPEGARFQVLSPLVRGRKGEHKDVFDRIRADGFVRVAVNGVGTTLDELPELDRKKNHTIEVVVDRLVMKDDIRRRLVEAVEAAGTMADGLVRIEEVGGEERSFTFSEKFACPEHGASLPELAPRIFSFNSPHGACDACTGLGFTMEVDPELVIASDRSLLGGAVLPWADRTTDYYSLLLSAVAERYGLDLNTKWAELSEDHQTLILEGPGRRERMTLGRRRKRGYPNMTWFEGVIPQLKRQHAQTGSDSIKERVEEYMSLRPCVACHGARLRPESLAVTVAGISIYDLCQRSVSDALAWFDTLELTETKAVIATRIIQEVNERLRFLDEVGVGYLTLERAAGTLSGGEAQRIRLATQIGAGLVGVLYILDEPSIGLHQRDNRKLIGTLERLRDLGNTVIVVEHDEDMMRSSDHVIDMGPGAGEHGGRVVAEGKVADIEAAAGSVTGAFLSGRRVIPLPETAR